MHGMSTPPSSLLVLLARITSPQLEALFEKDPRVTSSAVTAVLSPGTIIADDVVLCTICTARIYLVYSL